MSVRRNPVYVFKNKDSGGIYDIPLGSMIQVIDSDDAGTPSFSQLLDKNGLGPVSTIEQYLASGNYVTLDKDTTYKIATNITDGLLSASDFNKLTDIEDNATADQTKMDIDSLGIDATRVTGYTVGTDVPPSAIFIDTVYDDTVLADRVTTNSDNILLNTGSISSNTNDIGTNAGNIATNAAGIALNTADVTTNSTAIGTNVTDIATNATAIATNTLDIGTNTADVTTNTLDIATNVTDIATNTTAIATNVTAITTNATNIATSVTTIGTNTADIGTNATAIALNTTHAGLVAGNPHFVTKAEVGLVNVDNTSDAAKPISTLTQAAITPKLTGSQGGAVVDSPGTTIAENATTINELLASLRAGGIIA